MDSLPSADYALHLLQFYGSGNILVMSLEMIEKTLQTVNNNANNH